MVRNWKGEVEPPADEGGDAELVEEAVENPDEEEPVNEQDNSLEDEHDEPKDVGDAVELEGESSVEPTATVHHIASHAYLPNGVRQSFSSGAAVAEKNINERYRTVEVRAVDSRIDISPER